MGLFDAISNLIEKGLSLIDDNRGKEYDALSQELKSVMNERQRFLDNAKGYSYYYQYRELEAKSLVVEKKAEKEVRTFRFLRGNEFQQLKKEYYAFLDDERRFSDEIQRRNQGILKSATQKAHELIGNVEGRKLDNQQMACIVKDAHSHLVVAGAGTGKTTTILGKVKYLLATGAVRPEELLILSFTNASASEMKERLLKETQQKIYVATFHKLGYDIIRRVNHITPRVFPKDIRSFVAESLEEHAKDATYEAKLLKYILYHRVQAKSEFEFKSEGEYREYLETNPPTTILNHRVKSYGEMMIANFLAEHGVRYQYEAEYPVDTRTEEDGQYHPDFFLPDYNLYIEYFGIDRNGRVPDYFSSRDGKDASTAYQESIQWKRKLHLQNSTVLVECYAFENFEGSLLKNLKENLKKNGVELNAYSLSEVLRKSGQNERNVLSTVADLMSTVISLSKSRQLDANSLLDLCKTKQPDQAFLADLVKPIFEDYQNQLKQNNQVDFSDMINQAEDLTTSGQFVNKFKYVIVDEYQDVSAAQYRLLKAMRDQMDYSLFCVGDDWQSIYRFAGSDIGYILNFSKYWGDSELSRIETTYRFSQRLIDISGKFVMENPNQLKKYIKSGNDTEELVLGNVHGFTDQSAIQFLTDKLLELPKNSTVFLIGRYRFDVDLLKLSPLLELEYDNEKQVVRVKLKKRPDLDMVFYTAHRSKGLQADYVFILNNRDTHMGFPSKVQNASIIELLLEQADQYPDAEERRLFYVALTRARKKVYLVTSGKNISSFAKNLLSRYEDEIKKEAWTCPLCGGQLRKVTGQYGEFFGCSNYKVNGCRFKRIIAQRTN